MLLKKWGSFIKCNVNNLNKTLLKIAIEDAKSLDETFSDKTRAIGFYNSALENCFSNKSKMLNEIHSFDLSRKQDFKNYLDPMLINWLLHDES